MMIIEYERDGGMRIGRGNWSTQRKPAPVHSCPPQIPHDLTWYNRSKYRDIIKMDTGFL
jgi:hypothetical protein